MRRMLFCPVLGLFLLACNGAADPPAEDPSPPEPVPEETPTETAAGPVELVVTSPAFKHGVAIPAEYTCNGDERLPPLKWSAPPEGAASIAVIVDDPDAPLGTWVHWVVFDLPGDLSSLEAETSLAIATEATNSWGNIGWGGPCPPKDHGPHRYFFRVYALDARLGLLPETTRIDVDRAMQGHVLAQGSMMGTFERH